MSCVSPSAAPLPRAFRRPPLRHRRRPTRCPGERTPRAADLFGLVGARARCPPGTAHEPATYAYLLLLLLALAAVVTAERCCSSGGASARSLLAHALSSRGAPLVAGCAASDAPSAGPPTEPPPAELTAFPAGRAFVTLRLEDLGFYIGQVPVLQGLNAVVRQGEVTTREATAA